MLIVPKDKSTFKLRKEYNPIKIVTTETGYMLFLSEDEYIQYKAKKERDYMKQYNESREINMNRKKKYVKKVEDFSEEHKFLELYEEWDTLHGTCYSNTHEAQHVKRNSGHENK